ncbi:acyl-phosphate glycerol 3-phosphate acyltransferase [Candidatus Legionella polyplacis]|uniref:glycerol-3-phosphate 1-O-acyltransferase PlsY n=1 Tax=Candidatus Legionella polyplacis TaxID=2005262 RepID=UPI000C1EFE9A|nr:glycerol-3-phosphate 1-O-acyltransferase PlsY [Candidatus Legionella polyplacis]ATW01788.1 acyl-phosphate glycerol 3-phosphate acyltransferase [Candidatus Legionella polyplacis]
MEFNIFILLLLLSYLIGSLCFALIISKIFYFKDPRLLGSKNPGATNIFRVFGIKYGVLVLFFDIIKGVVPVLFSQFYNLDHNKIIYICIASIFGHMYPIFFKFSGGKGVATAFGSLGFLYYKFFIFVFIFWILIFYLTGYVSLASIFSVFICFFITFFISKSKIEVFFIFFIGLLIIYKHKNNIVLLINGHENKINLLDIFLNRNKLK